MKELHGTVENEQAKSKAIIEEKIKSLQKRIILSQISKENYMKDNPIGDYSGNVKILNDGNGTRVSDIGEFCEEIAILDSSPVIKKSSKAKSKKKSKQTTLF